MACKKKHGGPSLRTSLCTCERQHSSTSEELHTACVGRIVDRTYRVAKRIGQAKLADKIYQRTYRCRPFNKGDRYAVKARLCLLQVLEQELYGTEVDEQKAVVRKLRTAVDADSEEDYTGKRDRTNISVKPATIVRTVSWTTLSLRTLAVCAYIVGLLIILVGASDIATYWRRYRVRRRCAT
jgi:hypothetical protein